MRKMSSVKDQTRAKPYGRYETYDLKNTTDINDLSKKFSSINLNDLYEFNQVQKSTQQNIGMQMEIEPDHRPETYQNQIIRKIYSN